MRSLVDISSSNRRRQGKSFMKLYWWCKPRWTPYIKKSLETVTWINSSLNIPSVLCKTWCMLISMFHIIWKWGFYYTFSVMFDKNLFGLILFISSFGWLDFFIYFFIWWYFIIQLLRKIRLFFKIKFRNHSDVISNVCNHILFYDIFLGAIFFQRSLWWISQQPW